MSEHSDIGWTDATWPLVAGCEYVSPGCSNCWAVRDSWRLAHSPHAHIREAFAGTVKWKTATAEGFTAPAPEGSTLVWTGVVRPLPFRLDWPLKWRGAKRIFVCSQSDLFNRKVPFEFIAAVFGVAVLAQAHVFQVLTKHADRALEFFDWLDAQQGGPVETCLWHARKALGAELASRHEPLPEDMPEWPLPNVHFGVTVEDQQRADERLPQLLHIPAARRWLSVEPMLQAIDIYRSYKRGPGHVEDDYHPRPFKPMHGLDWVVCGGESAQTRENTRPFDLGWARALRDQCAAAFVPFFMKQLGTKPFPEAVNGPGVATVFRAPLPLPPGKSSRYKWHEPEHWPEDLRVQEFC